MAEIVAIYNIKIRRMQEKYDKIGIQYNRTRKADPYLQERIIHLLSPDSKGKYLDIGCGTGNYTHGFHQRGFNVIGIDPSVEMLTKAKANNDNIDWRLGHAENTNLESNSIDGIIASLTIHHWADIGAGFTELSRVLKKGMHMVIFTATPKQMEGYWLNHYFPTMMADSMTQMPAFLKIKNAAQAAGFHIEKTEPYSIKPDLQDLFLYSGKHNPDLYFQPEVRHGISSFSSLANAKEVEAGLEQLRQDITTGKIKEIITSYENEGGDYLFILLRQ